MNVLVNAIGAANRITEPVSKSILAYRAKIGLILIVLSALCVPLAFFPQLVADTGSAAFALLWFVLFIPILSKVFGLRIFAALMGLRKEIGILMGTLAIVHSMNYFVSPYAAYPWQSGFWIWENSVTFLGYGAVAAFFCFLLLVTSNAVSVKVMGFRYWKLLHRFAYVVLVFTVLHVVALEYGKHGHVEFGPIAMLGIYFLGKILEWKGINFAKSRA